MDNAQIPPIQPAGARPVGSTGPQMMPMGGAPMNAGGMPMGTGGVPTGAGGMPMVQQVQAPVEEKKDVAGIVKTVVIVLLSLIAATFIGLFIWMFVQYNHARDDIEYEISQNVAEAKDEQSMKDAALCQEEKENPYLIFAGPVDYGELSFEYPKTWSVYVARDASNGGNFEAYLNPVVVEPVSNTTINALRVSILDSSFESAIDKYQRALKNKDRPLTVESVTVNGASANLYSGVIPNTEMNGYILVFKIRDKTAVIQTDTVLFKEQFDRLIKTISFNA